MGDLGDFDTNGRNTYAKLREYVIHVMERKIRLSVTPKLNFGKKIAQKWHKYKRFYEIT